MTQSAPALVKPLNWGKALAREDHWHSRGAAADMYEVYPSRSSSGWCLTICGKLLEQDFGSGAAARQHAAEDWARRMSEAVHAAPGEEASATMAETLGQGAHIYGEPGLFKIRPLTWIDFDGVDGVELASGYGKPIARFTIFRDGEGRIRWKGSVGTGGVADSIEDAKRGAQADFDAWLAEAFIPVERSDDLDERMKALGMIPMSQLLKGDGPLESFAAHAGVRSMEDFRRWAEQQQSAYMRMRMRYELGEKSMDDDLYEWVMAHAGVFNTVMANLRAVARRSGEVG